MPFLQYKKAGRRIVDANVLGSWADSEFYADGDLLVCQLLECFYDNLVTYTMARTDKVRTLRALNRHRITTVESPASLLVI
jgi:hypothetical protein